MIRLGTAADVDAIARLIPSIVEAMRQAGNDQWGPHYPLRADFAQDWADNALFVDEEEGIVRGFVALNAVEPPEYEALPWKTPRPALVIHRLAVNPTCRRQGVARGLFQFAEAMAAGQGRPLRSDTSEANRAMLALFLRRGWRSVGSLRFPHASVGFTAWEKGVEA